LREEVRYSTDVGERPVAVEPHKGEELTSDVQIDEDDT
jgi:hypothetical protein